MKKIGSNTLILMFKQQVLLKLSLSIFSILWGSILGIGCATGKKNPWSEMTSPFLGLSESIGSPSAGCLRGALSLPPDGIGYRMMRISRRRYYAHPQLLNFIERLGKEIRKRKLGVLLIGDLSQPRGGPSLTGHKSHQTGLDVDIWYSQVSSNKTLTLDERESLSARNVLKSERKGLSSEAWTEREKAILELVAKTNEVERIFVTPWIKKDLCLNKKGKQEWLRKVRPWWGHADHFHVRLKCPQDSSKCISQSDIPAGEGCDSSLEWWFSEEAQKNANENRLSQGSSYNFKNLPKLPQECEQLLN